MKASVEKREASGIVDYIALALTTFGVGYLPGPTGTYGSAVAVASYLGIEWLETTTTASGAGAGAGLNLAFIAFLIVAFHFVVNSVVLAILSLAGIWASGRTIPIFGKTDPSEAVVDEVMGQLITFSFVPFGISWPFILAGFLLFRLFDIWKPFPVRTLEVLPDGYTLETCPAAERWWNDAARSLQHGKILTFDYGFGADEMISPGRLNGTLRAYRQHKQAADVLADPGEQDLTAHVNFARIEQTGIEAGVTTELLEPQGRFLTRLAAEAWKPGSQFGEWNAKRTRQFQTLTHPQHLGQSFRVLIQSRGGIQT